jgi:DNA-binding transcriptional ArsR family regulator
MSAAAAPDRIDLVAHALADGTRRKLLRLVLEDEHAAGELASAIPNMSRPAVSQHLRVLHDAGLVSIRAEGTRRLYRAEHEGLTEMRGFIDAMWADGLAKLKRAAERAEREAAAARS